MNGSFSSPSGFDRDPRFWHDYVAIVEWVDNADGIESHEGLSRIVRNGDFVRRDAVSDPAELQALQRENVGLRQ